jgi:hypothetical protein
LNTSHEVQSIILSWYPETEKKYELQQLNGSGTERREREKKK